MDPEKEAVFSDPEETSDQDRDSEPDQEQDQDSNLDLEQDSETEEDVRIFNAWMQRCRGELHKTSTTEEESEQEVTERTGSRAEGTGSRAERTGSRAEGTGSRAERKGSRPEGTGCRMSIAPPPRMDRRASLPCPVSASARAAATEKHGHDWTHPQTEVTLSSMTLSRLHVSTATPVTAKVLLRRLSSRRLLPPQEVPPPPGERERRGSLALSHAPPTIPEKPAPEPENPASKFIQESNPRPEPAHDKHSLLEKRGHFRRRNVMSLSDADSVCLICHNDLKHGTGGTRELQCSHTFHKECIEEYLWRRQQCPTCHVQVTLPQTLLWTSTLNVP